jgi:uncharacterized repeat protein (TIGR03843 family)
MAGARATTDLMTTPFRDRDPIGNHEAEAVLAAGSMEILGRMPWSSNATLLCDIECDGTTVQGVYKPLRGERPLWDFPSGLHTREVASYRLSEALGWSLIPPTVLRDGPLGIGSLQLFIPCDFEQHYFHFLEEARFQHTLQRFCAFDIAANSTDRKGGHIVVDRQDQLWGIDNGLSFHAEFKLRTVIWDWAGEPVPHDILEDMQLLLEQGLPDNLLELLDPFEIDAVLTRARALVREGHFPTDPSGRRYPWPLV